MFNIGEKIVYGENGVFIIDKIDTLNISSGQSNSLYYHLSPVVGTGACYVPVYGNIFMRPLMCREEAEYIINSIPDIQPAICNDTRFNHVDAFYRELFKTHSSEDLVAIIKGLHIKVQCKKARSTRAEAILKKAKNLLYSEIHEVLGYDFKYLDDLILGNNLPID